MSTERLIQVVKRIVAGPQSWSPQNPASAAEVDKRITLHPDVRTGDGILHWENIAKRLPSGRHVLFTKSMELECWSVADDRLVWTHKSAIEHASVLGFAAEETEGWDALVIMTHSTSTFILFVSHVEMIRLDLQSGVGDTLFSTRVPNSSYDNPSSLLSIRGALALVATGEDSHMILDWVTKSYFILKGRPVRHNAVLLLPQHVIVRTPSIRQDEDDEEDEIHIIAHDALRPHWAPTSVVGPTGDFASVQPHNLQKLSTITTPMQPEVGVLRGHVSRRQSLAGR
ncbi:hypothetical protein C8R47DRAFT_1240171 [Mycena vitilis]|nr:hypothetical protein C8R47DRAFT_1240171 [Mycena vitilis]